MRNDEPFLSFYQKECTRTLREDISLIRAEPCIQRDTLLNMALGLTGESGEIVDQIKKFAYQGHTLDKKEMTEELGDVLWYLNNICNILEIEMEDVIRHNVDKLRTRYPDGFSEECSRKRVDVEVQND